MLDNFMDSLKYFFFFSNFIVIYVLMRLKEKKQQEQKEHNTKKTCLLVIAHPDDESMFFIPTIRSLKQMGYSLHVLCFSNGNSKVREDELIKAGKYLSIDKMTVLDLTDKGIKDGMKVDWDEAVLFTNLNNYIKENEIKAIITFDGKGISGHRNHIAVSSAITKNIEQLKEIKVYFLLSVGLLRKYLLPLDLLCQILFDFYVVMVDYMKGSDKAEKLFNYFNLNPLFNFKAMQIHGSQFVWYRKLFVVFSRYTYINTLQRIN